jgi:putative intracellular protease/amidase
VTHRIGALVFQGFELLDLYGPLEMFGMLPEDFQITLIAEQPGPVVSGAGPKAMAESGLATELPYDILLVPGGMGTRREIGNRDLISRIGALAQEAKIVATVCTGAALLAATGLLDGRKATTNKLAFDWVAGLRPAVDWQRRARWVRDDRYFTSSGVSAGIDMSLAVIAHLCGDAAAREVATWSEYHWNDNAEDDPFALSD